MGLSEIGFSRRRPKPSQDQLCGEGSNFGSTFVLDLSKLLAHKVHRLELPSVKPLY